MKKRLVQSRLPYVLFVVCLGAIIGSASRPDSWFSALAKPAFQPPDWLFPPVWTLLYVLIGLAGWRVMAQQPNRNLQILWWVQLALNFLWSPAFFVWHDIKLALGIIIALLVLIILFIGQAAKQDKASAWLFTPYFVWVTFATVLNAAILRLNGS